MINDPMKRFLAALNDARETQDNSVTEEIYLRLRSVLQKSQNATAIYVLDRYREKPDVWEAALKDELAQIQADQDNEMLEAAERLISIEHTQQQVIFEYLIAETASLREALQQSNKHLQRQFEGRLRFSLSIACISLLGLFGIIIMLSEDNTRSGLTLLISMLATEALSILLLFRAKAIGNYVNNANKHLIQAEGIYQKLEFVLNTDDTIRHRLSHLVVEQLLTLSSKG